MANVFSHGQVFFHGWDNICMHFYKKIGKIGKQNTSILKHICVYKQQFKIIFIFVMYLKIGVEFTKNRCSKKILVAINIQDFFNIIMSHMIF